MSIENYNLIKLLGCGGGFGNVFLAKNKNKEQVCAIKIVNKDKINDDTITYLARENELLQLTAPCSFTVNLFAVFHDPCKVYFVMEYLAGGNLYEYMNRNGTLEIDVARFVLAQLVHVLVYIHDLGYVYCDIKPSNIMLGMDGYVKLIDFGTAKIKSKNKNDQHNFCGTPGYMAPEVLNRNRVGGHECARDWWAIGALAHQMLIGINCFAMPNNTSAAIKKQISNEMH